MYPRRVLLIGGAFVIVLTPIASAWAQEAGTVGRFGESLSLTSTATLTVTTEDAQAWRSKHAQDFKSADGVLTAFSVRFSGSDGEAFRFAVDERDAAKSDIVLRCGSRAFNFDKMAASNESGGFQFGSRREAGGFRVRGVDGRDHASIFLTEQKKNLHLVFFFNIPADCAGEKLVFALAQELGKSRQIFEFDAGVVKR